MILIYILEVKISFSISIENNFYEFFDGLYVTEMNCIFLIGVLSYLYKILLIG
jgi:hypothetical protein